MTLNAKLPAYKDEAKKIVSERKDDDFKQAEIINLCQKAFTDGVLSIMQKQTTKNKKEALKELNEDISSYYVEKNFPQINYYFMSLIKEYSKFGGKLVVGYEESITKELQAVTKSIFDMGFVSGVNIAQDPQKLKEYIRHKDKIENDEF